MVQVHQGVFVNVVFFFLFVEQKLWMFENQNRIDFATMKRRTNPSQLSEQKKFHEQKNLEFCSTIFKMFEQKAIKKLPGVV